MEAVAEATVEKEKLQEGDYHTLRFRSTGLGKTMLQGEPADVQVVDDMLVMHIESVTPVRWRIRAALSFKGLLKMVKMALKPSVIRFVLFGFR